MIQLQRYALSVIIINTCQYLGMHVLMIALLVPAEQLIIYVLVMKVKSKIVLLVKMKDCYVLNAMSHIYLELIKRVANLFVVKDRVNWMINFVNQPAFPFVKNVQMGLWYAVNAGKDIFYPLIMCYVWQNVLLVIIFNLKE